MKNAAIEYSDRRLLDAVHTQGAKGWEIFCDQFGPLINSVVHWKKWNFSEQEQQDVCQNVYIQLQSALPNFQEKSSLAWFIKKIAIHQCVDEVRRQVRWRTVIGPAVVKTSKGSWKEKDFPAPESQDPSQRIIREEQKQALYSSLQNLQETCQKSINLFYLDHRTYREISEQLGISVNTVGSRLSKCLDKLHKELSQNPLFERTMP